MDSVPQGLISQWGFPLELSQLVAMLRFTASLCILALTTARGQYAHTRHEDIIGDSYGSMPFHTEHKSEVCAVASWALRALYPRSWLFSSETWLCTIE